ncbi:MAG: PIN domain-containing protein [Thaumarchaeota archaeon]|nr:PIN domain-containing protein [Nitrososphaerota archaeon]
MKPLEKSLTFDSSVLIEYLIGSDIGKAVKQYFNDANPDEKAHCSLYVLSEIFYIMCRLKGREFAYDKISLLLSSNMISVHASTELALRTGELKCERAISLADCSSIATAAITGTKVVFAGEEELKREMARKPFETEILLLSP